MGEVMFELKPVDERPKRSFKKGSKYDPIIDRFLMEKHDLVKVEVEDKNAGYTRVNLNRLIIARGMKDRVKASVVNGGLYLETIRNPGYCPSLDGLIPSRRNRANSRSEGISPPSWPALHLS